MHVPRRFGLGAAAVMILAISSPAVRAASPPPIVAAKAYELVDAASGRVLVEKNARARLPMASVTKLMTLYLAVRAIEKRQINLRELVPVSNDAYRIGGSQIWLEPGERLTVDQMLTAIAVGSANDAAYALGEFMAGSADAFVDQMNQAAARLGMTDTHFSNPHGLHSPDHYTTAHDLGLLAERAVKMPLLLHYTSMWQDRSLRNGKGGTLWLINNNRLLRTYAGCDGLKTGYTRQAGFCVAATALRGQTRMIAVVLGAPTSADRFQAASSLMTWGFQHFTTVAIAKPGAVFGRVRVLRGDRRFVDAVVFGRGTVTVSADDASGLQVTRELNGQITAPVKKGQVLGKIVVRAKGRFVTDIPLVSRQGVREVKWPEAVWRFWWKLAG